MTREEKAGILMKAFDKECTIASYAEKRVRSRVLAALKEIEQKESQDVRASQESSN